MSDFITGEDRDINKVKPTVGVEELGRNRNSSVSDRLSSALRRQFEFTDDPSFNVSKFLKENPAYSEYSGALINSAPTSEAEAVANLTLMRRNQKRADDSFRASGTSHLAAMATDPTNLVPQLKLFKAGRMAANLTEAGITAVGIESTNQALTASAGVNFDINHAVQQVAIAGASTVAFASVLGFGGKLYGDAVNGAYRNNRNRVIEIQAMERLQTEMAEGPTVARAQRDNGHLSDEDLNSQITYNARQVSAVDETIQELEATADLTPDQGFKLSNMKRAREQSSAEFNLFMKEKTQRLIDEATVDGEVDIYALVSNYNPIPNPFSKILSLTPEKLNVTATAGLNMLKKHVHELASNQGNVTVGQMAGLPLRNSVFTNSITDRRTWASTRDLAQDSYAEDLGVSNARLMSQSVTDLRARVTGGNPTFKEYFNEAYRKRVFDEPASTPAEKRVMDSIDDFYNGWEAKRRDAGQIGRAKALESEIGIAEVRLVKLREKLTKFNSDARNPNLTRRQLKSKNKAVAYYRKRVAEQEASLSQYKSARDAYGDGSVVPAGPKEAFANRIYNVAAIEANPNGFKSLLKSNFTKNGSVQEYDPNTKTMRRKDLTGMSEQQIDEAVDRVYNSIVNDKNVMVEGAGFLDNLTAPSRQITLGNKDLWEFIHHDATYLMQKYVETSSPNLRFAELNANKTPKQVWDEIEDQLIDDGHSVESINMMRLNYGVLEERVMRGTQLRDPSRWDNKASNFLKQFTTLNYLTKSGVSSMSEFSKVISEHKIGDVLKGLGRMMVDPEFRRAMKHVKTQFGDANEINMGAFHQVVSEGMSRQVNPDDLWGKVNQANHILNGLGPISEFFKTFDGAMRQHTLVDYMQKTMNGTASRFESAYLNRYNLSIADIRNIMERAPIQQNGTFNLSNIDQWEVAGVNPDSVQKFRAAVQSGISNTVISATPADKPIFVDGVMFMKKSTLRGVPWARKLPEDDKYKGYVRVESGVGTIPFQFQSVVMAGMNKTLGAYTSGMVRNRYAGIFSGMALGYLTLWSKTPDYIWDQMDEKDKMFRAFDYASLAPLYSTLIYDSVQANQSFGGNSIISDYVQPKFKEDRNIVDGISMAGGPATSNIIDVTRGFSALSNGDFEGGADELYNAIPLIETLVLGPVLDQIADMFD